MIPPDIFDGAEELLRAIAQHHRALADAHERLAHLLARVSLPGLGAAPGFVWREGNLPAPMPDNGRGWDEVDAIVARKRSEHGPQDDAETERGEGRNARGVVCSPAVRGGVHGDSVAERADALSRFSEALPSRLPGGTGAAPSDGTGAAPVASPICDECGTRPATHRGPASSWAACDVCEPPLMCARCGTRAASICDLCLVCEQAEHEACESTGTKTWTAEALALPVVERSGDDERQDEGSVGGEGDGAEALHGGAEAVGASADDRGSGARGGGVGDRGCGAVHGDASASPPPEDPRQMTIEERIAAARTRLDVERLSRENDEEDDPEARRMPHPAGMQEPEDAGPKAKRAIPLRDDWQPSASIARMLTDRVKSVDVPRALADYRVAMRGRTAGRWTDRMFVRWVGARKSAEGAGT